ncbi:hypothetical protein CUU64_21070 [Bacillus sp. V5-8f]|nr:hypothetical protein CUU64_21070 [Bacillus sp. V5-8f]
MGYKTLKEYDHLELAWVRGKAKTFMIQMIFRFIYRDLVETKKNAVKEYNKMVLRYLKEKIG